MPNHLALNILWTEAVSVLLFDIPHSALVLFATLFCCMFEDLNRSFNLG
jgi:hypothetical protein